MCHTDHRNGERKGNLLQFIWRISKWSLPWAIIACLKFSILPSIVLMGSSLRLVSVITHYYATVSTRPTSRNQLSHTKAAGCIHEFDAFLSGMIAVFANSRQGITCHSIENRSVNLHLCYFRYSIYWICVNSEESREKAVGGEGLC